MDWKRIKTILILALIAINILLGYSIFKKNELVGEIEKVDRSTMLSFLNEKKINVEESLLEKKIDISEVEVKISSYDINHINNSLKGYHINGANDYTLDVIKNELIYDSQISHSDYKQYKLSNKQSIQNAKALLQNLGFDLSDIYIKEVGTTGRVVIIKIGQMIDGKIFTDSEMVIKFNNNILLSFNRIWYDVLEVKDSNKVILSPEYVLYEFVGKEFDRKPNRKNEIEIINMELVYTLNPDKLGYIVEGETSIYWQITTSNDKEESYIINAIKE